MEACVFGEEVLSFQKGRQPHQPLQGHPPSKVSLSFPCEASFALNDLHMEALPRHLHKVSIYSIVSGMLLSLLRFPLTTRERLREANNPEWTFFQEGFNF